MGKYTKTIGCKVESWVYDKIKNKYGSNTMYLRNLVNNDLKKSEKNSYEVVNQMVNDKKTNDESFGIDEKVDLILKRFK
jgi:hypothetical protein